MDCRDPPTPLTSEAYPGCAHSVPMTINAHAPSDDRRQSSRRG